MRRTPNNIFMQIWARLLVGLMHEYLPFKVRQLKNIQRIWGERKSISWFPREQIVVSHEEPLFIKSWVAPGRYDVFLWYNYFVKQHNFYFFLVGIEYLYYVVWRRHLTLFFFFFANFPFTLLFATGKTF